MIAGMNHKEVVAALKELTNGVRLVCARARTHTHSDMQFSQDRETFFKPPAFSKNEQDIARLVKSRSEEVLNMNKQDFASSRQKSA